MPTEIVSSDHRRALVSDEENNQTVNRPAFEILHLIAASRLTYHKLTVIDATNVQREARARTCWPINRALGQPHDTILLLISDLYEGGNQKEILKRAASLVAAGVQMSIPSFACTPDLFPELMAATINREDIDQWAAARDIVTAAGGK